MLRVGDRSSVPQCQVEDHWNKASQVADALNSQDYICKRNGEYSSTRDEVESTRSQSFRGRADFRGNNLNAINCSEEQNNHGRDGHL